MLSSYGGSRRTEERGDRLTALPRLRTAVSTWSHSAAWTQRIGVAVEAPAEVDSAAENHALTALARRPVAMVVRPEEDPGVERLLVSAKRAKMITATRGDAKRCWAGEWA